MRIILPKGVLAMLMLLCGLSASAQDNALESDVPLQDVWPAIAEPRTGDLEMMLAEGEIRLLTTFTLGAYFIDRGEQQGSVFEAARKLESFVREKLASEARRLKVTIIPVQRDQLLPYLNAGFGDVVLANLTITEQREQLVDFTEPYYRDVQELLVTGPGMQGIKTIDDVSGREVFVPAASSYAESIANINEQLRRRALPFIEMRASDPWMEVEDILQMVAAGLLPITVVDSHRLDLWSQVFDEITVHDDIVFRRGGELALALRKDSPQLMELLNAYSREIRVGTLFTNVLVNRYINYSGWTKSALESQPSERMQQLAGLFARYGEQYGFDWPLLASFAYQESGLDQDARSAAGAIGIMQVMPATAADRHIDIDNISDLENNIHAGTKYLAFLRERYFSTADINVTNRDLLTMAAYNAGPARINRLRKVAAERGLDPNVWFNHVEVVVAASVGRETVDYVGNIYRYYIAYKRALELTAEKNR